MSKFLSFTARPGLVAAASIIVVLAGFATPAAAKCKYGSPFCIDDPRPVSREIDKGEGVDWPEDSWVDPDCEYYGNCLPDNWDIEEEAKVTKTTKRLSPR
jgi:hypothetical protein